MKKITKFILGTAGGIGAAIAAESAIVFDQAFKKASPRQMERLLEENAPDPDFYEKVKEGIAWYDQQDITEVSVTSYDGLTLRGHWIANPNAKRTVICFHGFKSYALYDFATVMRYYYEAGCNVLLTEQRGHLISDGEYVDMGIFARFDVLTWLRYVNEHLCGVVSDAEADAYGDTAAEDDPMPENETAGGKKPLPIYLSGISMGAATVLMSSEFDMPDNVAGIIADCSYSDPWQEVRHFGKMNHIFPTDVLMPFVNIFCQVRAGFSLKDAAPKRAVKAAALPIIFIHGTGDTLVPVNNSYENYAYCASKKRLVLIEGAEHIQAYYKEPETYEHEIGTFFEKYDK